MPCSAVRVLLVDNFDSFTHNLAQALGALGARVTVMRHDESVEALVATSPDRVVLSPGPGTPARTGSCPGLLRALPAQVPVLGVCLGMQLMAASCGGRVERGPEPVHGWDTEIEHDGSGLFAGLPPGLRAGRYHSLHVAVPLPEELVATAWSQGVLMGLRHRRLPWAGVQFHPESVLTPWGPRLLANFLRG